MVRYTDVMPEDAPHTEDSSLERLRSRLYSTEAPDVLTPPPLSEVGHSAEPEEEMYQWKPPKPPKPKKKVSWVVLFFGVAVLFFLAAAGLSLTFLLHGGRSVSNDNITIQLPTPTSVASGATVPLTITILNHNPAAITDATITINFPDGTRSATDVSQPLVNYTENLGTIPAGKTMSRTTQAVLFGSANQSVTLPVTIQYHTAGSNALFTKQQSFTFTITSAPLSITAQSVDSVAAGQPFTIALAVRSSASTPLDTIAVAAAYPFGFTVQSVKMVKSSTDTSPSKNTQPLGTGSLFSLGTIAPGQEKDFVITGTLAGSNNDQRDFQFTVGSLKQDGSQTLAVPYASESKNITLSKPFLSTTLALNNQAIDPAVPSVVSAGDRVSGQITWVNTLSTPITHGQVSIKLSGNAFDSTSITVSNGYYDSSTNTITFNEQNSPGLSLLNPGDTGAGTFSITVKKGTSLTGLRNPSIQLGVSVSGQPGTGAAQTITNNVTGTVVVVTDLALSSRLVHTSGPFKNSGPLPPSPNKPTTYSVMLSMTNSVNSVSGATASMILPQYVTFVGQTHPNDGSVTYDNRTRLVTWKVADVPAGTGITGTPLTAAFQISFTPSSSQSASSPILVESQTLTGVDKFTGSQVGNVAQVLTTEITTDSGYQPAFGIVGN